MYVHLLNLMRDPAFLHDDKYNIIFANHAYLALTSSSFEDVVGKPYYTIFPKRDAPLKSCRDAIQESAEEHTETFMENGEAYVNRSLSFVPKNEEDVIHIHIFENIKFPLQLEELLNHLPQKMFVKDKEGKYLFSNEEYSKGLGLPSSHAIIGKNDFDFYEHDLAQKYRADDQRLMAADLTEHFTEPYVQDGKKFTVDTHKIPLHDSEGNVQGIIGIFEDITQEVEAKEKEAKAKEELAKLNEELEERVQKRTSELKNAYDEMEAFTYSVSHDLRSPLRATDGFSQAILEDYGDKLDATAQDYLHRIRNASQKMATLIDDLLQLSRQTRTDMDPQDVDLGVLAQTILEKMFHEEPERNVEIVIGKDLQAYVDKHLIQVVFDNLLQNAWKYTSHHKTAKIEIGSFMKDTEKVFYIKDDGAGFDMEYVDKLFKPFQRLHTADDFPGNGIGLAMVYRIIKRHFGKIWIEGEEEKGTTVFFTLALPKPKNLNEKE